MDIYYLGHSSFHLRSKDASVVTDPFDPIYTGLKFPPIEADIVSISHDHKDHNYVEGIKGTPLVLTWPGEFEKNDVRVTGFATQHDGAEGSERGPNVMYKFEIEGLNILHCGDLGHLLSEETSSAVGEVDILMIPVGGVFTIPNAQIVKLINEIEAKIIIPMHYQQSNLNASIFGQLQPVDVFLKERGAEGIEPTKKLTVKKESLSLTDQRVVVMSI
ncbi:MAG: MBL fold metallo-hydrolase [bacterium]|nr:MBL fold metallo-hydrolase [bacterium]